MELQIAYRTFSFSEYLRPGTYCDDYWETEKKQFWKKEWYGATKKLLVMNEHFGTQVRS